MLNRKQSPAITGYTTIGGHLKQYGHDLHVSYYRLYHIIWNARLFIQVALSLNIIHMESNLGLFHHDSYTYIRTILVGTRNTDTGLWGRGTSALSCFHMGIGVIGSNVPDQIAPPPPFIVITWVISFNGHGINLHGAVMTLVGNYIQGDILTWGLSVLVHRYISSLTRQVPTWSPDSINLVAYL